MTTNLRKKRARTSKIELPRMSVLMRFQERPSLKDVDDSPLGPQPDLHEAPPWSPLYDELVFKCDLRFLFTHSFFIEIDKCRPTTTQARRLSEVICRLDKLGLLPEWLAPMTIAPEDFVHLLALAIKNGPSAVIDLVDIIGAVPKAAERLQCAFTNQFLEIDIPRAISGPMLMPRSSVNVLISPAITALEPLGLVPLHATGTFFLDYHDEDTNDPAIHQMTLWYALEDNDEILRIEARRVLADIERSKSNIHVGGDAYAYAAAHRFLDPTWTPPLWPEAVIVAPVDVAIADAPEPVPAPVPVTPAPKLFATWRAEPMPEGIEMSQRAMRELRKETVFAEDRFNEAIETLVAYRDMRLGKITPDDYAEACRARRFTDAYCFASEGSFSAFKSHYEVRHENRTLRLERHLKWGKSNNARSALRVYYAWDETRDVVVIGSAPRHLPIWRS